MSSVECTTVELRESSDRNWRRAYHEQLDASLRQYRQDKQRGSRQPIQVNGRRVLVRDATYSQLIVWCERETGKDLERAIIQHDHEKGRRQFRVN